MQHKLAKMTAGTPSLEPGFGGIPELTGQDVAAALGFASSRVPRSFIGIHAVLAKHTDDDVSRGVLQRHITRLAWMTWLDMGISAKVSRQMIDRLAEIAVLDYTEPGKFAGVTKTEMARMAKVDKRTWSAGLGKVYPEIMNRLFDLEEPVMRMLAKTLKK